MKPTRLLPLAAGIVVIACQSDRPLGSPPGKVSADISDGAHCVGTPPPCVLGNPHFFFLPPMVKAPTTTGTFNPNLAPDVTICRLGAGQVCVANTAFSPGPMQLDPSGQQYKVNWNTDPTTISTSAIYRIIVSAGGQELGFADVQPVSNGSQLKNVETGEFVGLVDGRTLPIKFRIEQGATCFGRTDCLEQTVGPNPNGRLDVQTPPTFLAAVSFPQGYLTQAVTLTIARVSQGCFAASSPPPPFAEFGCYSFSTSPPVDNPLNCTAQPGDTPPTSADIASCARVEVCPTLGPDQSGYHDLRLYKSDPGIPAQQLKEATATLITQCQPWVPPEGLGLGRHRMIDLALERWHGVMNAIGRLVMPQPLFGASAMAHLGLGGMTCCFSNIGWARAVVAPPALLQPINGALIPQNNPDIGCTLSSEPTRGFGFQIVFDWTDATSSVGITGYELFAKQKDAVLPIVNTFVEGASQYTFTDCNSFVADGNLTGWEWRVRARDNAGVFSDFVTGTFGFEPCRLPNETACRAP